MSNLSLRLIVLTIALFFYQTSYAEIQANLLGHWALDESSGTIASDSSGNANNGIVRNATGNPWSGGNINGALGFDGNSDVSVPTTTGLQPSSLSLSAWVNLNSGNDWSWIAGEGDNFGMLVEQGFGGTWLYFYIHNGTTWVNAHANNLPISDQQWHHLVGTFDEATGEIKVYVDGSRVASNIVSGSISYAKRSGFHIGSMDGQRLLNGKIDDVRLYGQVLTQSEIEEVSNDGGTGGPNNQAPTVSAGSNSNTLVDIAIALNGTVTDDGLPIDSIISSQWTKVSGPSDVVFSETNNPSSTAIFSAPGDYVLRLTATDGDLSSSDEINVTVGDDEEQNQAPSVSAGADQSTLINSINLAGTVSDDGLPDESIVSTLWNKVSGPGDVSFSDATNTTTNATFSALGNYVLSLTATDGDLSNSDEINITVIEDAVDSNQAPTVSAGADQNTLITDSISLSGNASDDGLPAESILSTQWTTVSGPGVVTFGNENSAVTNAVFSVAGTYILSLSATDGELTSSDETTVIVTQDTGGIDITTGLLGHWPLDETTGTNAADVSGNGNTGSVRNNIDSSWQAGQLGGALAHDGNDDDIRAPTTTTLQPSSLTLSSWVKPSDKNDWGWVAGEGDNFGLYIDQGFGGQWLYFYIYNGSTWVNAHVNNVPIFDGQWHHIAATFDEATGEIKVYANSIEVASSLVSGSINYNRGSGFHIGSMSGRRHFKGSIDDVRLYGRVLDQASIAAVSGDGTPPTNDNSAPVIEDLELIVDEDSGETIITMTAQDADGDNITFALVGDGPTNGTLTINSADFSYRPNDDFTGIDSFTYKANDGTVDSATATVTITVNGINDAPTADAGSDVSTEVGVSITLTGSGTDIDEDQLSYSWSENGAEIANTATFDYTPTTSGEHTLTLTVNDGAEVATDELTVNATIVAPSFEITFFNDITVTDVPRNLDSGLFVQGLQLISSVTDGSGNPVDGAQPEFNVESVDLSIPGDYPLIFTYPGATPKTLIVRVFNNAPQATGNNITVDEDSSNNPITLIGTDSNQGDTLTYSYQQPVHGTVSGTAPNVTYTPTANYSGSDEFTFTVSDGIESSTATIRITVTDVAEPNEAPVAVNKTVTVIEDSGNNTFTLIATDANSGDTLTFTIDNPANGTVTNNGANVVYKPNANFSGTDSFTFTANDGTVNSNTATVTIDVTAVNDTPVANALTVTVEEDSNDNAVLLEGTDEDSNDTLSFIVVTQPTNGSLTGIAPNTIYTPNLDSSGQDSFTYKVNDGTVDSETVTVTINISAVNDSPVTAVQTLTFEEDSSNNPITLEATDIEDSDGTLTFSTTEPTHGDIGGTGASITYTPDADYFGSDSFTYTATDSEGATSTSAINITITDVEEENQPPIATGDSVEFEEDSSNNLIVLSGDDPDGDNTALTYSVVSISAGGTFTLNGQNLLYTPAANFHGIDEIVYTVSDGDKVSDPATILVTITDINDPPQNVSAGSDVTVAVNESVTLNGVGVDHDGESVSYSWTENGDIISTSASFNYTPTTIGLHSLTLTVTDDDNASVSDTLIVEAVGSTPDSIVFNGINNPFEIQAGIYSDLDDLYERALRDNVILLDQNGDEYQNGDYELFFEGYAENEDGFDTQTPGNYFIFIYYEDDFGEFFIEAQLDVTVTEANNDPILIMPLGDSITAGDGPGDSPRPSYRRDLWHALSNTGYNFDFVGSEHGYTNTTISPNLQDFDPDYEAHPGRTAFDINSTSSNVNITDLMNDGSGYTPDIALIHLGTNDLLQDGDYVPELDDLAILNSLAGIINQIKAKNSDVVILLAQIIPIDVRDVSQLNAKVKQQFENTAGVVIVDQQSGFTLDPDTFDGIHASASGELKMADRWYKALIRLPIMGSNFNTDSDGDGVNDLADAFPLLPSETIDSDADGIGNNVDTDDDNDGFSDVDETNAGTDPLDPADFPDNVVQAPFLQAGFINSTGFSAFEDQTESATIRTYDFSGGATSEHDFNIANSGGEITNWELNFDSTRPVPMEEIVVTDDDFFFFDHGTIPGTEFDISINSNTGIVTVVWPLSFIQGVNYRIDIEALQATITASNSAGSFTRTISIVKPNGVSALDHQHDSEGEFQCDPGRPHGSIGGELGFLQSYQLPQLNSQLDDLIDNGEDDSPEADDLRAQISDTERRIEELEYMLANCPDGPQ